MKSIMPFRCGYGGTSGYSCVGVGEMHSVFTTSEFVFDKNTYSTFPDGTPDLSSLEDTPEKLLNYWNLPAKFKSTVTATDYIAAFEEPMAVKAPEVACTVCLDPFTSEEALGTDKMSSYGPNVGQLDFYAAIKDQVRINNVPATDCADFTDRTLEFLPGILEPMIDADFSAINIEVQTAFDSALDGILLAISNINTRIKNMDLAMDALSAGSGYDGGLRKMLQDREDQGSCSSFNIAKNGDTYEEDGYILPLFDVSGGVAVVCGRSISVGGLTDVKPGDTIYCNIVCGEKETDPTASLGIASSGDAHVVIGSVVKNCSTSYYIGSSTGKKNSCYCYAVQDTCAVVLDGLKCCVEKQLFEEFKECVGFIYHNEDGTFECYEATQCEDY